MHLSFSLYGADEAKSGEKGPQIQWHVLNLFLQSIGIVLTDVQDVIFKYSWLSVLFLYLLSIYYRHKLKEVVLEMLPIFQGGQKSDWQPSLYYASRFL